MNHPRRILAAVITLAGAVLALATAPAAFARPLPPPDCCATGADARGDRHHRGRHARLADHPDRGRRGPGRSRHGRPAGPRLGGTQGPCRHRLNPATTTSPGRAPHNRLRGPGPNGPLTGPRTSRCAPQSRVAPAAAFRMTPGSRRYC